LWQIVAACIQFWRSCKCQNTDRTPAAGRPIQVASHLAAPLSSLAASHSGPLLDNRIVLVYTVLHSLSRGPGMLGASANSAAGPRSRPGRAGPASRNRISLDFRVARAADWFPHDRMTHRHRNSCQRAS
jgi:hypothetical protein